MSTTTTPTPTPTETLLQILKTRGFTPGKWDTETTRIFDRLTNRGSLRVVIDGGQTTILAFSPNQVTLWTAEFTGAPTSVVAAAIGAAQDL